MPRVEVMVDWWLECGGVLSEDNLARFHKTFAA